MPARSYKIFPQTSDLGVEVTGNSIAELFINAGLALVDLAIDMSKIASHETTILEVNAENRELLFREWLSEILYQIFVKERLFVSFRINALSNVHLKATAIGERIDYRRHSLKRELKSITYYKLQVSEQDGKLIGRFVIDI